MRQFTKLVVLQFLRAYKWAISPMFPPACRYIPTCSDYAMEAVDRYGALRGTGMTFLRLLRCHPFAHGGYDPVVKQRACNDASCESAITQPAQPSTSPASDAVGLSSRASVLCAARDLGEPRDVSRPLRHNNRAFGSLPCQAALLPFASSISPRDLRKR
jgi:putative membrane protein insertion efficiency factor